MVKAENLLHQARIVIKDMAKHVESDKRLLLADKTKTLQYVIDTLIGSFDVPTLMDNLAVELPRIGIKSCYLSVHTTADKIYKIACLLLAFNENGRIPLGKNGFMYTARHLLPKAVIRLKRRYNIIFQPLIFRTEQMGFVGLEFNPLEEISGLALSELIRSSLKASMMMQEIIEKDKKLSDLDRLKNDFIANITHDFRSHLTVILNSARLGLISETKDKFDNIVDRYNIIYEASVKLKQTIDRLLDLAKMDALGIKLRIQKLELKAYLESIINFYKSATASSGVTIQSRLPEPEVEDFYTDVDKLEEILHNLVSNALKFVDPRKGIITISLLNKKSTVEIRIRDNGIGIPKDKLEIIFGRFEQLDEQHNIRYPGTGIGLAFAKELTRYLRGSIRAESEGPGKGACFILELKKGTEAFYDLSIDSQNVNEPSDLSKRSQLKKIIKSNIKDSLQKDEIQVFFTERNRENEYDPKKGVILIVDDDPPIREIVKEYLERAGYINFITATNGRDAIDAVYRYSPDLIISDYNMPKMRGDEMQDIIASNPYLKQTPVLFLTVMTDKRIIQERKEQGVLTFLTKPIDEKEFLVSVDIHMRKHMEYLQLLNQAPLDSLTGLANRTTILVSLEDLLMLRVYRHLSVILLDLDDFTALNKEFGYRCGDGILADIGKIIKDSLRGYDRAGRYNAQEFLIILPESSLEQTRVYAEKLRGAIGGTKITVAGKKMSVSASLGVSSLIDNSEYIRARLGLDDLKTIFEMNPTESTDWRRIQKIKQDIKNLLLDMAQQALSRAKKSGKNKTCVFSEIKESH
jgi:diguanylate cyclase (GGDEF)-like protein